MSNPGGRLWGAVAVLACVVLVPHQSLDQHAVQEPAGEIRARRITLETAEGKPRMVLEVASDGEASIVFLDELGRRSIALVDEDSGPELSLRHLASGSSVKVSAGEISGVFMYGKTQYPEWRGYPFTGFVLISVGKNGPRVSLVGQRSIYRDAGRGKRPDIEMSVAGDLRLMKFFDKDARQRLVIGVDEGEAAVRVDDRVLGDQGR